MAAFPAPAPDRFRLDRTAAGWLVMGRVRGVWQHWAGPWKGHKHAWDMQERFRRLWGITWKPADEHRWRCFDNPRDERPKP
jgi:hypothetical protein